MSRASRCGGAAAALASWAALWALPIAAHVDVDFPLTPDGHLQRFPDAYGPASLLLHERGGPVVRIGGNEVRLPECIARLLEIPPDRSVHAHGSWYHDFSVLPPYLIFDFPQGVQHDGMFAGHSLMFDMRSGSLHEIRLWELYEGGGARGLPIEVADICSETERESLAPTVARSPAPRGATDDGHGKRVADCRLMRAPADERRCLEEDLEAASMQYAEQTGWFDTCAEASHNTAAQREMERFRRHFCQEHQAISGDSASTNAELRCELEFTEALLAHVSELAAAVCLRD